MKHNNKTFYYYYFQDNPYKKESKLVKKIKSTRIWNLESGTEESGVRESSHPGSDTGICESEILNILNLGSRRSENQVRFHESMNPPIR